MISLTYEVMYDLARSAKSCLVCKNSLDGGVTCPFGPVCSKGRHWRAKPYTDFYEDCVRREKYELQAKCADLKQKMQEAKADGGKLQIHMVPMQIVRDIAEVRMYGTKKYGDEDNWKRVELMRYVDALLRHTLAFANDIHSVDEESGIPHYKHMECNLAFISELMKECETDGVFTKTADPPGE